MIERKGCFPCVHGSVAALAIAVPMEETMTAQSAQFQLEDFSDEPSVLTIKAAYEIACQLGSGKILTRKDINAIFKELTGSSDAAEAWTVKMYGCALELAELFWLRAHNGITLNSDFS